MDFPNATDLTRLVHFNPQQGKIWLDEQRGILQTLPSIASIWQEIVQSIGVDRARSVFMRSGYRNGQADGEMASKHRPNASIEDLLLAGPQLHMLRGMTNVAPSVLEIDVERGHFLMEHVWHDSYEVDICLAENGMLDLPVCWTLAGYASGFSSRVIGFDILFKEVSCRGKGDTECRVIGKSLKDWDEANDYELFSGADSLIEILYDLQSRAGTDAREQEEQRIFSALVGESEVFRRMCAMANKVATSRASVLLTGETGVGKELIAQGIHEHSERSEQPFVAVNCAAIPQELLEAELFGVEKGAFTGATHSRQGRFERAHKGSIFLDEVVELSARAQASLLRVLQEQEFERVGGSKTIHVDVRLIAATNEDLEEAVKDGKFRADLYYRLNVFPLHIPPLRERLDDIPLLAGFFIEKYGAQYNTKTLGLSDRATNQLLNYSWPGNIRELENVIERGVILTGKDEEISVDSLFPRGSESEFSQADITIDGLDSATDQTGEDETEANWFDTVFEESITMEQVEAELVQQAMERSGHKISKAARLLGMSRPQFAYRLKKIQSA